MLGFAESIIPTKQSILKDGLISYWALDEVSGTIAYDSHNSNHLSIRNLPTLGASGKINTAYQMGGTSDLYLGSAGDFAGLQGLTVSCWIYPVLSSTAAMYHVFVSKMHTSFTNPYYVFQLRTRFENYQSFEFWLGSNSTYAYVVKRGVYSTYNWIHLVGTFDGTSGAISLYVNGVKQLINSFDRLDFTANTTLNSANTPLIIGDDPDLYSTLNNFTGKIDEVAIWDRQLSDSEIAMLYNGGNGLGYSNF